MHFHMHGIDLVNVRDCIVTHTHMDHLYTSDIEMFKPGFAQLADGWHITFYGSEKVGECIKPVLVGKLTELNVASFEEMNLYVPKKVGDYTVTPLKAIHSPLSGPLCYQISDGENTVVYGNDTNYFDESVWEYWEKTKPYFDMVSLDCTFGCRDVVGGGHMGFSGNLAVRDRMLEIGLADERTLFISHHFSHNGVNVVYDDFVAIAAKENFLVSYDGMIINL